ncbi:glycoside hydrolase family 105 protein [Cercospora zeae-maydis SCOH1-5]|uniref:Glycoside hydrolase family 105 protein n=1 Tax=Cercospora zeae-maydis SCOH1-5 TaxID=717836 RepID=A0A6A6FPS0_9PEZI|nr:glycoside hydrolase family 105 protein [Cercospora zeae-maydis SCOH1-5]
MLESNIARRQGLEASNASTGQIELGLFQQALRESIAATCDSSQKQRWQEILTTSVVSANGTLSNATRNTELPLDRLSIGTAMIQLYNETKDETMIPTIRALQQSVIEQKRNSNGGLWYYDNPLNQSAYHNLSYLDGMFSYAPFAILSQEFNFTEDSTNFGEEAALKQLRILRSICEREDGLYVHGYDPTKDHAWAKSSAKGSSPIVWARAQAWYTLGVVNAVSLTESSNSTAAQTFKDYYHDLIVAQLDASDKALERGGYGVWQVVDRPNESATGNFIEASSTLMTAYSMLKGARLGWLEYAPLRQRAETTGLGLFQALKSHYLSDAEDGSLNLNGTSSVASLSGNVDYDYYVTRPTVLNSLIGTSAFILAALEAAKRCEY